MASENHLLLSEKDMRTPASKYIILSQQVADVGHCPDQAKCRFAQSPYLPGAVARPRRASNPEVCCDRFFIFPWLLLAGSRA